MLLCGLKTDGDSWCCCDRKACNDCLVMKKGATVWQSYVEFEFE